jgi:hypothetical protein
MSSLSTRTTAQPTSPGQNALLEDTLTAVLSPEPASEPPQLPEPPQPSQQRLGRWFGQHRVLLLRRQ